MDFGMVAAIVTAIAGLIGLFFGRRYWDMLQNMVSDQDREVRRLQHLTRSLRDRLDEVERNFYDRGLELERCLSAVDNFAASNQLLINEAQALRKEKVELQRRIVQLEQE